MKQKYRYMKMIALFLSLVMIVCSTPMTIIAEPVETDSAEQQVSDGMISESMEIVESEKIEGIAEVISLREENAKHFKRTDGTYEMVVYPTAVHRKDENGNWQDINNNLTLQTVKNASFYATADART